MRSDIPDGVAEGWAEAEAGCCNDALGPSEGVTDPAEQRKR